VKHLLIADKTLLVGDEVAELLLRYGALLAQLRSGDSVSVHATDTDGNDVTAGLLLNSGTALVIQSATTSLPEPANAEAEAYLRSRIASYDVIAAQPLGGTGTDEDDAPWGA
jgi:hypothetical protein